MFNNIPFTILMHLLLGVAEGDPLLNPSQDHRRLGRSRSDGNGFFLCGKKDSVQVYCVTNRQICVTDEASNINSCKCIQGWGGSNCLDDIDECSLYNPCPGGKEASYCVNMFMPIAYKCQCRSGFTAILPNITDGVIPADFRPIACEANTEDPTTSKPATSPTSSLTPSPVEPKSTLPVGACKSTTDCQGFLNNNFLCSESGTCVCKPGYFKISANCQDKNECFDKASNNCHRNADCFNLQGSFFCYCKDGYEDVDTSAQPGSNCRQTNECLLGTHDCESDKICVDRTPPSKWECIDPSSGPSPAPTSGVRLPAPTTAPVSLPTHTPSQSPSLSPTQIPTFPVPSKSLNPSDTPTNSPQPTPTPSIAPSKM